MFDRDDDRHGPGDLDRVDTAHTFERMIWRTIFLGMFVVGIIAITLDPEHWTYYLALIVGGLGPGMFLISRESHERLIERQRAGQAPERRVGGLPPVRQGDTAAFPVGAVSDDVGAGYGDGYGPPADPEGFHTPGAYPDSYREGRQG